MKVRHFTWMFAAATVALGTALAIFHKDFVGAGLDTVRATTQARLSKPGQSAEHPASTPMATVPGRQVVGTTASLEQPGMAPGQVGGGSVGHSADKSAASSSFLPDEDGDQAISLKQTGAGLPGTGRAPTSSPIALSGPGGGGDDWTEAPMAAERDKSAISADNHGTAQQTAESIAPINPLLADIVAAISKNDAVFTSAANGTALVISEDGSYRMITQSGDSVALTPETEGGILVTTYGTECELVAVGDGFALGKLANDAYVFLAESDGKYTEYTLAAIKTDAARSEATDEALLWEDSRINQTLSALDADGGECSALLASTDWAYALAVVGQDSYKLFAPDGTTYNFTGSPEELVLESTAGTVGRFIAGGDGYSLAKWTDDAYVLLASNGDGETYTEYTLSMFESLQDFYDQQLVKVTTGGTADISSGPDSAGTSAGSSGASGSSAPGAGSSVDPAGGQVVAVVLLPTEDGDVLPFLGGDTTGDSEGTPEWAMSIAERRVARRHRYDNLGG